MNKWGSPEWHGIKAIFVDFLRQKAVNGVSNYVSLTFFSGDIAVHVCCNCSAGGSSFLSSELM